MKTNALEIAHTKAAYAAYKVLCDRNASLEKLDRAEAKRDAALAAWKAAK